MRRVLSSAAAAFALVLACPGAHAQSNYRSSPIGGRTTLMGGTGIADARDGAAPFLNPATIVRVDPGRLTFSVNFYSLTLRSAPRWFRPGPVDGARFGSGLPSGDATRSDSTFDALPSSLCVFFKSTGTWWSRGPRELGHDPRLALCFATTQRDSFDFSDEIQEQRSTLGVARQAQTIAQSYSRFAIGPTYAFHVTEDVTVGASLHGSLVSQRDLVSVSMAAPGVRSFFFASSRGSSLQLSGIVGATYRFGKQTVGLALESPSLHVLGSGGLHRHTDFDGPGRFTSSTAAEGSFVSRTPLRIGIGTALAASWGTAAIDFSYYAALQRAFQAELQGTRIDGADGSATPRDVTLEDSARTRGVVNASAGAEVIVSPSLSLLAGASTDVGAVSPGTLGRGQFAYFAARGDRVAGSLGVRSRGVEGDLLFGTEVSYARGERLAVNAYQLPPEIAPTPEETVRILLVIAGSTSFRAIRRAVEDVTDVLGPRPR